MTKAKLTAVLASVALAASLSVPAFAYEQVEDTVSYGHGYNDAGYLVIHETANPGASASRRSMLSGRKMSAASRKSRRSERRSKI